MAVGSVMAGMPAGPGIALAGAYKKEIMELIKTKGPEVLISLLQTKGKLDVIKILYHKLLAKNALQYYHPAPQGVAESQLNELSPATLASYKKKAGADASAADKKGDYKRGDKRMSGIIKATKKEFDNDSKNVSEDDLDENCWKGYHKEGNKELFGKTVPNCVKNEDVAEEQHSCPHCGGEMVSEELMNEKKDACYYKVKSRYKVWPSAYASGALVKCRKKGASNWGTGGKKNESSILEGIEQADESLHDWFNKEKWVRMDTKGNIKGPCAREPGEGKPKCLPQSKAHSLGKKGRASAAQRKRREDPNPERSGKAINVNTKKSKG
jgi:hypothetical protein